MIWKAAYGLLVDDGQLAIGVIVALALAAGWAALVPSTLTDLGGPLLLVALMGLLLVNLRRAARKAGRAMNG